jgi:hypothetical protein
MFVDKVWKRNVLLLLAKPIFKHPQNHKKKHMVSVLPCAFFFLSFFFFLRKTGKGKGHSSSSALQVHNPTGRRQNPRPAEPTLSTWASLFLPLSPVTIELVP